MTQLLEKQEKECLSSTTSHPIFVCFVPIFLTCRDPSLPLPLFPPSLLPPFLPSTLKLEVSGSLLKMLGHLDTFHQEHPESQRCREMLGMTLSHVANWVYSGS